MPRNANSERLSVMDVAERPPGIPPRGQQGGNTPHHALGRPATDVATTAFPRNYPRPVSLEVVGGIMRGLDGISGLAAALAALAMTMPDLPLAPSYHIAIALLGTAVMVCALSAAGVYRIDLLREGNLPMHRILVGWASTSGIVVGAVVLSGAGLSANRDWLLLWFVLGGCVSIAVHTVLSVWLDQLRQAGRLRIRVAIFGSGAAARALLRRLDEGNRSLRDHVVVGLYDNQNHGAHSLSGNMDALLNGVRRQHVDAVIVALASTEWPSATVVDMLRQAAADIYLYPDIRGFRPNGAGMAQIGGVPLLAVEFHPLRNWRGVAKAVEDRVFAAFALLLVSPVLLLIAMLIKLDSPGPVLFRQKRYGLNNQLIEVLKFRTMRQDMCDPTASQLTQRNDPRVTRIGALLRRTSLDELPQFINVLRGDMSVVGPRPHAVAAKAAGLLYQEAVPYYDCRHRMKPGITGLAQVSGWRGETETLEQIRKRVEHDVHYIENWSLLLDAQIILRTIFGGFTGRQAF